MRPDIAGYSRLIGADEAGTLSRVRRLRTEAIDPTIAAHDGRIVKTTGDGLLVAPVELPAWLPYRKPEHREFYLSGLRLAMGAADEKLEEDAALPAAPS